MQSRNFRLQRVGDINWLEKNYRFHEIAFSLDELIILNASRTEKDITEFSKIVSRLACKVFLPITAGGGIRQIGDAEQLFNSGADKLSLNTVLYSDPVLVDSIAKKYGQQSIVAIVDYKIEGDTPVVYIDNGTQKLNITLLEYIKDIENMGAGEVVLNSIDKDGTGFGYDLDIIERYKSHINVPLVVSGGAGNEHHLAVGLNVNGVSAVSTANLFNFIGNGLPNARSYLIENGFNLADWRN
jgi:cyclase